MLLLLGILVALGDEGHLNEVLPIWKPNEEDKFVKLWKKQKSG
jgi:hypothetical protein